MKIAFDATVVHGPKSGVGYYCQDLVRALVSLESDDEYLLFSHRPLDRSLVAPGPRVRFSSSRFCPVRAIYLHGLLPGLLAAEPPDLIHYTNFLAPIHGPRPYVVTVHDMSLERLEHGHPLAKRLYTKRLIPPTVAGARLILTNSAFSKWDTVRFLGVPEDRIRVTPLAASPIFRPVPETDCREVARRYAIGGPYFLFVGNLEPRKNLERLLEAFAGIPDRGYQLVIAGSAWFRGHRVAVKIAALGLGNRVRLLGRVPRADLPPLMGGATAFVYPSLLEGFGLPVLEAMACGTAVVTSSSSALGEVAGDAALKVDPRDMSMLRDALVAVSEDAGLRRSLERRAVDRAAEFSWNATARATRAAYQEACSGWRHPPVAPQPARDESPAVLQAAVRSTLEYADRFDYPLSLPEIRERLFHLPARTRQVAAVVSGMGLEVSDGYVSLRPGLAARRRQREEWTDRVLEEFMPKMRVLASVPFVRMLAFSGASAHRNMTDRDVDLFAVVEDGRLWATLIVVTLWAKARGLRRNLCLNYILSDRRLPLFEVDAFTAQQAASLKPFYGKEVYDEFIRLNRFVRRTFPNFDPLSHRSSHRELTHAWYKKPLESVLRLGFVQFMEVAGRILWGGHLARQRRAAAGLGETDVILERGRIKLHLRSHRWDVLRGIAARSQSASVDRAVPGPLAPSVDQGLQQKAQVQSQ
jgi:glycosyltransferase involved in cell wall biosynthesis